MRHKLLVECPRCAHQQTVERAGHFRDADYRELLQDYFAIEQELKVARRLLAREREAHSSTQWERDLANSMMRDHLWPLAKAQLRVRMALLPDEQPA